MPGSAELSGGHEERTLGQQAIDILVTTRQKVREINEANDSASPDRLVAELKETLDRLSEEDILVLARPAPLRGEHEFSPEMLNAILTSQHIAEAKRQREFRHQLILAYRKLQSSKAKQVLEGKRITATALDDRERFTRPIRGLSHTEDSPTVSGIFHEVDADTSLIFIQEDTDSRDAKIWSIQVLGTDENLLVDLQVE